MACVAVSPSWEQRFATCNARADTLTVTAINALSNSSTKPRTNADAHQCTNCCANSIAFGCSDAGSAGLAISSSWEQRIAAATVRIFWREREQWIAA